MHVNAVAMTFLKINEICRHAVMWSLKLLSRTFMADANMGNTFSSLSLKVKLGNSFFLIYKVAVLPEQMWLHSYMWHMAEHYVWMYNRLDVDPELHGKTFSSSMQATDNLTFFNI